jgi:putative ABC transport system permease protein
VNVSAKAPLPYRLLLLLLPPRFRRDFGADLEAVLVERLRDARSAPARGWIWMIAVVDVLTSAPAELAYALRLRRTGEAPGSNNGMDHLKRDLRFALRSLARRPGFTAIAIIAVALGIGANTTIFSIADRMLFRLPPYDDAERLVVVWEENPAQGARYNEVAPLSIGPIRDRVRGFEQLAVYAYRSVTVRGGGEPERLTGLVIDAKLLPMIGIEPALGRNFTEAEDIFGAPNVALISHRLWQRRFDGDPDIIGRTIELTVSHTIIGVMPADFHFAVASDVWLPVGQMLAPTDWLSDSHILRTLAKLSAGVSVERARAELNAVAASLETEHPRSRAGWRFSVHRINDGMFQAPVKPMALLLLGAVGFVLLIVCADVANLLLARGAGRTRELAIRIALGVGRARLVRQLLTESLLLALAGGAAGTLLAVWALDLIRSAIPASILEFNPRVADLGIDPRVLGYTAAITVATGLLFGLLPSLRVSRPNLADSLKEGDRTSTAGGGEHRLRAVLVGLQAALAIVLVTGGAMLMRSFLAQQSANPGLRSENLLTMQVQPRDVATYDDRSAPSDTIEARLMRFHRAVLERIAALPEVDEVALTSAFPLSGEDSWRMQFEVPGQPTPVGEPPLVSMNAITPGYFALIGVPLRAGRAFGGMDREGALPVAIVSESFARTYLPGEDPIGHRVRPLGGEPREIIGVVADVQDWRAASRSTEMVYWPLQQFVMRSVFIVVRTRGEPAAAVPAIRRAVYAVDAGQPVFSIRTMRDVLDVATFDQRMISASMAVFALVALLLAAVGVYGVMAYAVSQRTPELAIRIALGARPATVIRQISVQGMRPVVIGLAFGVVGAYVVARMLSRILWAGAGLEATSLAVAAIILTLAALAAVALPAWRATRVDPVVALRVE